MAEAPKAIVWFQDVGKEDVPLVGGKGANLGEMTSAGIPVPPGFIVTADAYYEFIREDKLEPRIRELLEGLDVNDSQRLQQVAEEVKNVIRGAVMPAKLAQDIAAHYRELKAEFVAVRSSATAEDLPDASFAGQQRTYLNVSGEKEVVAAVQECWASLFEPRAIFYREENKYDHFQVGIAIPVQKMVQSEASGVMFTLEPITADQSKIVIEAIYGLGEAIVGGEVTPDLFVTNKTDFTIVSREINQQDWYLTRNPNPKDQEDLNVKLDVAADRQSQQKISDAEVVTLAKIAKRLEDHYGAPQDIEWAKEKGSLFITQSRPVTTANISVEKTEEIDAPVIVSGGPASPGVASGTVKVLASANEIDKVLDGDILVAEITTPDFVPAMKRAVAIVTNRGGRTSHAAIVSRELGVPCVVGTGDATTVLNDGDLVTVDGGRGKVYQGRIEVSKEDAAADMLREQLKTKTRVYVNLAQPDLADRVATRHVDGVGLLRAEFIVGDIGEHPRYMLKEGRGAEFTEKLYYGINAFAKAFHPRPVVYRCTDFKTNEYRDLKGGAEFEDSEENPMIGYRGCSRYLKEPDVFDMEIAAIKRVREKYQNLYVMLPFVRTVPQLKELKEFMESRGLVRNHDFKLWMMVEVPSNIILIEDFIEAGIDGISIGSNDLTQLMLGIDRDSEKLRDTFDERNEAVMRAIRIAVTTAKKMGITCSICGQAPSEYPEVTEKLVEWGITSVSVTPDMIGRTREIIAKAEQRLGIDAAA